VCPEWAEKRFMPYIKPDSRLPYEPPLTALIAEAGKSRFDPGHLNYLVSRLINAAFEANHCYAEANKLLGVLEAAKLEFYRRKVAPYEDVKITENGDV